MDLGRCLYYQIVGGCLCFWIGLRHSTLWLILLTIRAFITNKNIQIFDSSNKFFNFKLLFKSFYLFFYLFLFIFIYLSLNKFSLSYHIKGQQMIKVYKKAVNSWGFFVWNSECSLEKIEIIVEQEFLQYFCVAGMMREVLIPFWRCSSDSRQVVPWTCRKIMVLNVITQIQVQNVPHSKIVVGLNSLSKFMVFGDDVNCWRMGSDRYHPCNEDVEESPSAPELEN